MKDTRDAMLLGRTSDGRMVQRPLSPHLQVYRPQISTILSILHRATGIALSAGTLLLAWWLVSAATSDAAFHACTAFINEPLGWLLLLGWTVSLFYHLLAGIRHLFWDAGYGFEIPTFHATGMAVVIGAVALTVFVWIVGLIVY